jgi:hypothetical protein
MCLDAAELLRSDGVEVVGVGVAGVVLGRDGEGVAAAQRFLGLGIAPQGDADHHVGKAVARHLDEAVGGAEGGQALVEGLDAVEVQGGLAADENGEVHPALLLGVDEMFPVRDVFVLASQVLVRREEEATLAAQVAGVGDVVDRAADVEIADLLVAAYQASSRSDGP